MKKQDYKQKINYWIRASEVRIVDEENNTSYVMKTEDAIKKAQAQSMDLIEISYSQGKSVCIISDLGRFNYQQQKRDKEQKKKQVVQTTKQITLRPATAENDLNIKLKAAKEFLAEGHRVQFVIRFRGREITHQDLGKEKLDYIVKQLDTLIMPITYPSLEGKLMSLTVQPAKK